MHVYNICSPILTSSFSQTPLTTPYLRFLKLGYKGEYQIGKTFCKIHLFLHIWVICLHIYICTTFVPTEAREAFGSSGCSVTEGFESPHGFWTWVLCKSSNCSKPLHFSSPRKTAFKRLFILMSLVFCLYVCLFTMCVVGFHGG